MSNFKKGFSEVNTPPVLKICKGCLKEKPKIFHKKYTTGQVVFIDDGGSRWEGETCPDCLLAKRRDKAHSTGKQAPLKEVQCIQCFTPFKQSTGLHKFCSHKCFYRHHHPLKPPRLKKVKSQKPLKEVDYTDRAFCILRPLRSCITCSKIFRPRADKHIACKNTHTPGYRRAKSARRAIERYEQPISSYYILELIDVYSNRPRGYEVDHIVPINGENVSGLHVPWNLQYLTPKANNEKSNKF